MRKRTLKAVSPIPRVSSMAFSRGNERGGLTTSSTPLNHMLVRIVLNVDPAWLFGGLRGRRLVGGRRALLHRGEA